LDFARSDPDPFSSSDNSCAADDEAWPVPELSRTQIAAFGALAVALLLIGARSIRAEGVDGPAAGEPAATASFRVSDSGSGDVVVHVAGAVVRPGVYRLPAGARVTEAVERAGGAAPKALLDAINLAARLADGQQVVVPEAGPDGSLDAAAAASGDGPISLGTATVEQLDTIQGIGPVTAQQIVEFRDRHGGLSSVDQLDQISGIGPATMDALRERIQP
jgi:competence protein ComEA